MQFRHWARKSSAPSMAAATLKMTLEVISIMLCSLSFKVASNNLDSKHVLYGLHVTEHPLKTSPLVANTSLKNDFKLEGR